jgi:hypothetical protein
MAGGGNTNGDSGRVSLRREPRVAVNSRLIASPETYGSYALVERVRSLASEQRGRGEGTLIPETLILEGPSSQSRANSDVLEESEKENLGRAQSAAKDGGRGVRVSGRGLMEMTPKSGGSGVRAPRWQAGAGVEGGDVAHLMCVRFCAGVWWCFVDMMHLSSCLLMSLSVCLHVCVCDVVPRARMRAEARELQAVRPRIVLFH